MIEFDRVKKTYPDGTVAVDDVSLLVDSHTCLALLGSSGSGKTTLLRMINRMIDPTSGTVRIDGEDVSTSDPVALRRRIGYVIQGSGLMPHGTVEQNIATVLQLNGQKLSEARPRVYEVMETVGLDPNLSRRYPAQLSGGQKQRVGVARALASDPKILLMDEPFGAVDPLIRRELQHEMVRLQSSLGKTIVLVTHDVDEAFALGNTIALMAPGGRVVQSGSPQHLAAQPANEFARDFLGLKSNRRLVKKEIGGTELIVDEAGIPVGRLAS